MIDNELPHLWTRATEGTSKYGPCAQLAFIQKLIQSLKSIMCAKYWSLFICWSLFRGGCQFRFYCTYDQKTWYHQRAIKVILHILFQFVVYTVGLYIFLCYFVVLSHEMKELIVLCDITEEVKSTKTNALYLLWLCLELTKLETNANKPHCETIWHSSNLEMRFCFWNRIYCH